MARKNFNLDDSYDEIITIIKEQSGIKYDTGVVEEALVLMAWAVSEVAEGNSIASRDESGHKMREITTPALQRVKMQSRLRKTASIKALSE